MLQASAWPVAIWYEKARSIDCMNRAIQESLALLPSAAMTRMRAGLQSISRGYFFTAKRLLRISA